jgi:hypothetical protein
VGRNRDPGSEAIGIAAGIVVMALVAGVTVGAAKAFACHAKHPASLGTLLVIEGLWLLGLLLSVGVGGEAGVYVGLVATATWFIGLLLADAALADLEKQEPPEVTLEEEVGQWW